MRRTGPDLGRREAEIAALETFNYTVFDDRETKLLGCVYIDPLMPGSAARTDTVVVGDRRNGRR
jgi:hypothetical protein